VELNEKDFKIIQLFCFVLREIAIGKGLGKLYDAIEEYINWYNLTFQPVDKKEILNLKIELIELIRN